MEVKLDVGVQLAPNYFSISNPSFIVTGPIHDGSVQLDIADDFISYPAMTLSGEVPDGAESGVLPVSKMEFTGATPSRIIFGRLKMNPARAKELSALLSQYADMAAQVGPEQDPKK